MGGADLAVVLGEDDVADPVQAGLKVRDVAAQRAWMARGYAIGLGAGTQVLTHLPWMVLVGQPSGHPRVLLMLAGWVVNLAVVEWALHRRPARPVRRIPSPRRATTPVG